MNPIVVHFYFPISGTLFIPIDSWVSISIAVRIAARDRCRSCTRSRNAARSAIRHRILRVPRVGDNQALERATGEVRLNSATIGILPQCQPSTDSFFQAMQAERYDPREF